MAAPATTLWKADPHTLAKHELLRRYLHAWLPIMARNEVRHGQGKLLLIDGFAGPGRYAEGQPGSPLVMLDALFSHSDRESILKAKLTFLFIENDARRVEHLRGELAKVETHPNVVVHVIEGAFDDEMSKLLDDIPADKRLIPTFAFIDPFGYKGSHVQLSSRILGFSRCEVLIYIPLPNIARFVGQDDIADALDNLFDGDSWRLARTASGGREAETMLHDIFLERLRERAGFARSFEMDGARGWSGYHLFFGTGHPAGIDHMKYAMWRVDPAGGAKFADSTNPGQIVLFEDAPDLRPLRGALVEHFAHSWFRIEEAEQFTLLQTPFHPAIHLKRTLRGMEIDDLLEARDRRKARTYPPGTRIRFR